MIGGEILSATSDLIKFYECARDMTSFRTVDTIKKSAYKEESERFCDLRGGLSVQKSKYHSQNGSCETVRLILAFFFIQILGLFNM